MADVRGLTRLVGDATVGVTNIVEAVHESIVRPPWLLRGPRRGRTTGLTGFVYRCVRAATRLVGEGADAVLRGLTPAFRHGRSSPEREALLAILNGVLGDHLVASGNLLAIAMSLRSAGTSLQLSKAALKSAFPQATGQIVVLAHGLCMNDLQWAREGHDHGAALARDLGYTPLYLHYNTGRHISTNGREFAEMLETLVREWPRPIERLAIVGHSMGGLVARSACRHARLARHDWIERLGDLVFLGTPHFGASLERAGVWADFLIGISRYSAPFARIGKLRSAGIKDLGHARLCDEDWQEPGATHARALPTSVSLPAGVRCYAVAGSRQRSIDSRRLARGDGLVAVNGALGMNPDADRALAMPQAHRFVAYRTGHFDLLSSLHVYAQIRTWLAQGPRPVRVSR